MRFSTLVTIASALVTQPLTTYAWGTNSTEHHSNTPSTSQPPHTSKPPHTSEPPSTTPPQNTEPPHSSSPCPTITTTSGSSCPKPTDICITLACIEIKTVTQPCSCPSIAVATECHIGCPTGCAISYSTVVEPCPTSKPTQPPSQSPPGYPNSTITETSTTITTISTCPPSITCSGQTTTWTSTNGPYPCPPAPTTCTCVLPPGTHLPGTQPPGTLPPENQPPIGTEPPSQPPAGSTVTQETVVTKPSTPEVPVPSETGGPSSSPTIIESNEGVIWGVGIEGFIIGLVGVVIGML